MPTFDECINDALIVTRLSAHHVWYELMMQSWPIHQLSSWLAAIHQSEYHLQHRRHCAHRCIHIRTAPSFIKHTHAYRSWARHCRPQRTTAWSSWGATRSSASSTSSVCGGRRETLCDLSQPHTCRLTACEVRQSSPRSARDRIRSAVADRR
jgi:hypothetical protein